jgi:hypothetical protein
MALSDWFAPALQLGSTFLTAGSQLAAGSANRLIGKRRKDIGEFEAQQLELEAAQSRGVGMRTAQDETLKTELVNSAALARAAASGAGASDPTVLNIISRTAGVGAYRSSLAMYEGEAQARMDLMRAETARAEGDISEQEAENADTLSKFGAASTLLSGAAKISTMYDKYWAGPKRGIDSGISGSG